MKTLIATTSVLALLSLPALAGGMAEPVIDEPIAVAAAPSSSSGGVIVPLLLLVLVAAAVASSGGDGEPEP